MPCPDCHPTSRAEWGQRVRLEAELEAVARDQFMEACARRRAEELLGGETARVDRLEAAVAEAEARQEELVRRLAAAALVSAIEVRAAAEASAEHHARLPTDPDAARHFAELTRGAS